MRCSTKSRGTGEDASATKWENRDRRGRQRYKMGKSGQARAPALQNGKIGTGKDASATKREIGTGEDACATKREIGTGEDACATKWENRDRRGRQRYRGIKIIFDSFLESLAFGF